MPPVDEGADLRERGRFAYRKREWGQRLCAPVGGGPGVAA